MYVLFILKHLILAYKLNANSFRPKIAIPDCNLKNYICLFNSALKVTGDLDCNSVHGFHVGSMLSCFDCKDN